MAKILRSEPEPLNKRCLDGQLHNLVKFDDERMVCSQCGGVLFVAKAAEPQPCLHVCSHPTYIPCTRPHYPTSYPWDPWWGTTNSAPNTSGTITISGSSSGTVIGPFSFTEQ